MFKFNACFGLFVLLFHVGDLFWLRFFTLFLICYPGQTIISKKEKDSLLLSPLRAEKLYVWLVGKAITIGRANKQETSTKIKKRDLELNLFRKK